MQAFGGEVRALIQARRLSGSKGWLVPLARAWSAFARFVAMVGGTKNMSASEWRWFVSKRTAETEHERGGGGARVAMTVLAKAKLLELSLEPQDASLE